jgi:hypothetical protein
MMKWLMVLVAMFTLVSPGLAVASTGAWGSVSNQVASSWDQVKEANQGGSMGWGGSKIFVNADPVSRCRRICRKDCETIASEICYGDGFCKIVVKLVCNSICEILCDDLYP